MEKKIDAAQRSAADKKKPYPHAATKNPDKPATSKITAPNRISRFIGLKRICLAWLAMLLLS